MNRAKALLVLIACGAAVPVPAAGQASLTGHVAVTKVLTRKRITLPSYQLRGAAIAAAEPASTLSSASRADELARVVVYLEGPGLTRGTPAAATLTQKNRRFDPEIVVIPAGSTVSFPNADPIYHNVFSLSKVMQFDLGYYPTGQTRLVKFERPGVVQVYCHLHTDMSAAILVVPTRHRGRGLLPMAAFHCRTFPQGSTHWWPGTARRDSSANRSRCAGASPRPLT